MVRRHGWQLPAHTLQVAAITVFFLLAVAYYIFLAPFLWLHPLVDTAYAVYSPLALAVILLHIRCTAINPADPGVLLNQQELKHNRKNSSESSFDIVAGPSGIRSPLHRYNPSSLASVHEINQKEATLEGQVKRSRTARVCSCAGFCGLLFGWIVAPDDCCRFSNPQQPVVEDDILFCTFCNAEVRKFSKHCRSCDKCVDGFDHHCRWLNNCIGRKNYKTFVGLMSTTLLLLIVESIVGTAVFVRCFVDKRTITEQIMEKLGNGFTRAPFAAIVAVCTMVAMLACIPLGELFFFHLILIKKGISTYEYVVAVRAQPGGFPVEDERSPTSSASSSTMPGMSRSSSLGLQHHGGWCTPPRIFVEHEDEVLPHPASRTLSATVHPEQQIRSQKSKPANVRISAWRLAKLNKDDATQAAANARKASSVLRPIAPLDPKGSDESYSSNSSGKSSLSTEFGTPGTLQRSGENSKSSMSLSPFKSELPRIRTGREAEIPVPWSRRLGVDLKASSSQTRSDLTSTIPESSSSSTLPAQHPVKQISELPTSPKLSKLENLENTKPSSSRSHPIDPADTRGNTVGRSNLARTIGVTLSDGYDASGGETTDDMGRPLKGKMYSNKLSPVASTSGPSFGNRAVSRYGGVNTSRTIQFKGRGISTSVLSAYQSRPRRSDLSSSPSSASDGDPANPETGPYATSTGLSTAVHNSQKLSSIHQHSGNLQISGPSIFFSSPLMPIGESRKQQQESSLPPPPPPASRSGIPKTSAPESSSRSTSRVTALPPQTPPFTTAGDTKKGVNSPPNRYS